MWKLGPLHKDEIRRPSILMAMQGAMPAVRIGRGQKRRAVEAISRHHAAWLGAIWTDSRWWGQLADAISRSARCGDPAVAPT
jgi:hypothetical protein